MADPVPTMVRGKFFTGAKPSPRLSLMMASPFRVRTTPPPQVAMVPKKLSVWDNDVAGCCVTSEEAAAIAAWSSYCGIPEVFATDAELRTWAKAHGFYNGADLTSVMDAMATDGMSIGGVIYKDGGHTAVDYTDETNLRAALASGPVKLGLDHRALPDTAGMQAAWVGLSDGHTYNESDHCVGLLGYGPAAWLCQQLGAPLPAKLTADKPMYLLFTWGTIGLVDYSWIPSTTSEAWSRNPTVVGISPAPSPNPSPGPKPSPIALPWGGVLNLSVDGTNKIVTVTPPEGFDGQINVEPPPYTPS